MRDTIKCRLRLENSTRWGSAFLVLEMVYKAYKRKAFENPNEELRLPVSIKTIIMYLKILKPAYSLNINFQSDRSSIADVIPKVSTVIHLWKKQKSSFAIKGQEFCNLLIEEFETRFNYELNSKIYLINSC